MFSDMKPILLIACLILYTCTANVCNPYPGTPVDTPIGKGRGIHPGRVTWVYEPDCCLWNENDGTYYYQSQNIDEAVVDWMFMTSINRLTGATTDVHSWHMLFNDYNLKHHGTARNYTAGEKIAVKINLNTLWPDYECNNGNGITPQYLKSFLRSLTRSGVPQDAIYLYDASRMFSDCLWNPPVGIHGEFPNVHVVDNMGSNGREKVQVDNTISVVFSNTSIPMYNTTYLPTVLTSANYVIEIDAFRGHVLGGITESGKNWFGSIYRPVPGVECDIMGYWCPASIHEYADVTVNPMGSYNVLVDLLGHPKMGGAVMLFLADGLYSGIDMDKTTPPTRWLSMYGTWSSSVFASQDPIAMDSVMFDVLRSEPTQINAAPSFGCTDNYLHEAAAIPNPPSGVAYNPTGTAPLTESLGVHEHWNSHSLKQYSRNLGKDEGIELIYVRPRRNM